jgi:hypothetical protein
MASIRATWWSVRGPAVPACAALLCAAALGCGGQEAPPDDRGGATEPAPGARGVAQPPPESSSQQDGGGGQGQAGGSSGSSGQEGGEIAPDAETGAQPCPDVVITPNSGNGLFEVEAEGITCEDASAALATWGQSGYPGDGPQGFVCEEVSAGPAGARLRCEQESSGGIVEFDTGT